MKKYNELSKQKKIQLLLLSIAVFIALFSIIYYGQKIAKYDTVITYNSGCKEYYKNNVLINSSTYCIKERMKNDALNEQQKEKEQKLTNTLLNKTLSK